MSFEINQNATVLKGRHMRLKLWTSDSILALYLMLRDIVVLPTGAAHLTFFSPDP